MHTFSMMNTAVLRALRIIIFGFLTWLIPFIVAMFFYTPGGELVIDIFTFKTVMIIVSSLCATVLLVLLFLTIFNNFLKEGIIIGFGWLILNWVLDALILLPMNGMDLATYFSQIGLRYLVIPFTAIGFGFIIEKKVSHFHDIMNADKNVSVKKER
jgi:hypothetical protein